MVSICATGTALVQSKGVHPEPARLGTLAGTWVGATLKLVIEDSRLQKAHA